MREQATWIAVLWVAVPGIAVPGIAIAGCVLEPVELTGRGCPCIEGWVCDEARDLCVPEGDLVDAGRRDGGVMDAGRMDASTADARVIADAGDLDADASDAAVADASTDAAEAGPEDAGAEDAAPDAGAPDAGPPTCVPGLLFCDDFETGDLARWTTVETPLGGSIAPTTSGTYRGSYALRITAAPGTRARIVVPVPTAGRTELHYRGWVRVWARDSDPRIDAFVLAASTSTSAIRGEILPLDRLLGLRAIPPIDPEIAASSAAGAWDTRTWACVRGHVVVGDAPVGRVELYQGTRLDVMLADVDTAWGAPLDLFAVTVTAGAQPADVRFDELVWSATALACP